jgi:hypothetical protein
MILGLFIRNFKTYQGMNFVPLSDNHKFCGLLGRNGIGKSSVLEALDCFFNGKEWNLHFTVKRNGLKVRPYIVPVFSINKDTRIPEEVKLIISKLDNLFRTTQKEKLNFGSTNSSVKDTFISLRDSIINNPFFNNDFVFPIGVDYNKKATSAIFDSLFLDDNLAEDNDIGNRDYLIDTQLKSVYTYLVENLEYIYIPKDIDSKLFTRLENQEIQTLMGEKLDHILRDRITETAISEINKGLTDFINEISNELDGYVYRTSTDRQQNLRKSDIHKLIIDSFFNIRKLHKRVNDSSNYVEISSLSSGEKQKAIIDVAKGLLENHRADGKNLIVGIDEPESSLHVSACFEQFDSLFKMSNKCRQIIFSSHWYGFLPTLTYGNVSVISEKDKTHQFDLINLQNYQEQIVHLMQNSKGKLPYDINLKSITDFIQSILSSITSVTPYNWIFCEGSSEKIYFDEYFKDEIQNLNLRIIPTGGAKKIKRIYQNILTPYNEIKENIDNNIYDKWGKILFLSDTDSQLVHYETQNSNNKYPRLQCCRLINNSSNNRTERLAIDNSLTSPATEIEDCLNGKLFVETLKFFKEFQDYDYLKNILEDTKEYSEEASYFSLNLRPSDTHILKEFFDSNNGNMKIEFAKKYVELMSKGNYQTPSWISEIKRWINT